VTLAPRTAPSRWAGTWPALVGAWAATLAGLTYWLTTTPVGVLRDQLKLAQFWSLELCVALGAVLVAASWRDVLGGCSRTALAQMGSVALLSVVLTLGVAPRTNRIYYDEQIYQGIGQNLADLRLAQMCNEGIVEYGRLQCTLGEYNKQPYAYPHLLSLGYRVFGVTEAVATAVNAAAVAVSVCAVYLLVLLLFADVVAAGLAALVLALTPHQLLWSATAAVEPTASMAAVLAVLAAAYFCRARTSTALFGAAVAAAWAVQFRPESALVVPVVALVLWQGAPGEFRRPRLWWAGLLALLLIAVHLGHLAAVRNEGWGTDDARLALKYVAANLRVNGGFFLGDERFPVAFTALAVVGALAARRRGAAIVLHFVLFFGITLFFYAGSYDHGADVRYSLMTYPAVAILAGVGAAAIATQLAGVVGGPTGAARLVAAALGCQFLWYAPVVRATTEEAWAARADVRFAASAVPALRGNTYVLTHNPGMFHLWGVNAGQMSQVAGNPSYLDYLATRYAGGVYVHWNFWCNVQVPEQQDLCRVVKALKPLETMREYRERDYAFAFYRLVTPAPPPTLAP
jgi:4-amino-4-deoxy-L-arabinose transferase-like glycosyltransferase